MALEINYPQEDDVPLFTVQDRLCLTEDDRIVPEGDPEARWLYAVPGQEIPWAEAEKYGLVNDTPADADAEQETETETESPEATIEVINRCENADDALVLIVDALDKWPADETLLALRAQAEAVIAARPEPEPDGPTLSERIDAVTTHAQANELAGELDVAGFEEKKPSVAAKKQALHDAAKAKADASA